MRRVGEFARVAVAQIAQVAHALERGNEVVAEIERRRRDLRQRRLGLLCDEFVAILDEFRREVSDGAAGAVEHHVFEQMDALAVLVDLAPVFAALGEQRTQPRLQCALLHFQRRDAAAGQTLRGLGAQRGDIFQALRRGLYRCGLFIGLRTRRREFFAQRVRSVGGLFQRVLGGVQGILCGHELVALFFDQVGETIDARVLWQLRAPVGERLRSVLRCYRRFELAVPHMLGRFAERLQLRDLLARQAIVAERVAQEIFCLFALVGVEVAFAWQRRLGSHDRIGDCRWQVGRARHRARRRGRAEKGRWRSHGRKQKYEHGGDAAQRGGRSIHADRFMRMPSRANVAEDDVAMHASQRVGSMDYATSRGTRLKPMWGGLRSGIASGGEIPL